jgi:transposase InsO family protein
VDCYDGRILTYTMGASPDAQLVNTMLVQFRNALPQGAGPTIHFDQGCHYQWPGWLRLMKQYQWKRSMSRKGCSPDNSACEGFFGRLKNEMYYSHDQRRDRSRIQEDPGPLHRVVQHHPYQKASWLQKLRPAPPFTRPDSMN